jgi:pectinesterase
VSDTATATTVGAVTAPAFSADRPRLDRADAPVRTVADHLAGTDGWAPHRGRADH